MVGEFRYLSHMCSLLTVEVTLAGACGMLHYHSFFNLLILEEG